MPDGETNGARPALADEQENAAREAALAAMRAEVAAIKDPPGTLTLSNGIMLRIKAPPQHLLREVAERVPPPPVPMAWIEEKARSEENPGDPDYLIARARWADAQYMATADVALLMGTECLSVPADAFRPEDDGWLSYLRILGVEPDLGTPTESHPLPPERYWAWLRLYALRNNEDSQMAVYGPLMMANVSEEDVALAIASFRRAARRGADLGGSAGGDGANGDRAPADLPRADQRVRGARGRAVRAGAVGALGPDGEA